MSLREQIESARRAVAEWPEWMRRLAYFEGGDKSGLNTPPSDKPPVPSGTSEQNDGD